MSTAKKSKSNVVNLRAHDFDLVYQRSHASGMAIAHTIDRTEVARQSLAKSAKKEYGKAVKAYASHGTFALPAIQASIKARADADRLEAVIASLKEAALECRTAAARASSPQGDMFVTGTSAQVNGMGWASGPTLTTVFACFRSMDKDGIALDQYQAELFSDMSGAGLESLDLGLDAASAVEQDGTEADPSDEDDDLDDMGLD